jgi:hypothetical protein
MSNWYKIIKLSSLSGEFWIIDGNAIYADGDIGDLNHEGIVILDIILGHSNQNNEDIESYLTKEAFPQFYEYHKNLGFKDEKIQELWDDDEKKYKYLIEELEWNEEEIKVIFLDKDARDYAMEHLGHQRMAGNNIQAWKLEKYDLTNIANGIYEAYGDNCLNKFFFIEILSSGEYYENVPYEVIESGSLLKLRNYKGY